MEYQKDIETLNGAQWNPIHEKIEASVRSRPSTIGFSVTLKRCSGFWRCKGLQGVPLPGAGPVRRRIRLSSRSMSASQSSSAVTVTQCP